ncbi:SDR family NAD(P)-dependent oxidoreductase [Streptosporangium sp. NPDC000396]|uniref:SDR family NAD(P)-dependent oxidoreductase n=1 Tax=Streptosporangium sp. NPDC000396 TaxID=3366185 RepID=UPI00367C68F0
MNVTPRRRNVLVTGGSSGIGRETVLRFARGGDTVWFTYATGEQRAKAIVDELAAEGVEACAFQFDQGDWDSHEQLLTALPGTADILVNNAAVGSKTVEEHERGPAHQRAAAMLRINSLGPLWLTQQILPGMLKQGYGKVINVSSVGGGIAPFPYFDPADGMSKASVVHFTRQLAVELAHSPVEVFGLCPGAVETPMLEASVLNGLNGPARQAFEARLPKGRMIQAHEVAEVIQWLCGNQATILHGAVIDASMGLGLAPGLFEPETGGH